MLLEFRCKNYKSFKDEVVFSMVASKDNALMGDNTAETGLKKTPHALKSAAIYGANASGKSNLLQAMQFMMNFVIGSFQEIPDVKIDTSTFKMQDDAINIPSLFEMTFMMKDVKYQYGFEVTTERVISEWFYSFETQRPKTIFTRAYNKESDKDVYDFPSGNLKGDKQTVIDNTRHNALFLSSAIRFQEFRLTYEIMNVWRKIIEIEFILPADEINPLLTNRFLNKGFYKNEILSFVKNADTGISDIIMRGEEGNKRPLFIHNSSDNNMEMELYEQSTGTQVLYFLISELLLILNSGYTLIIDELDKSLHPSLVRKIVELFHDPKINTKGAQLIFTTHDVTLLNNDYANEKPLFRRDQVWFTDKDWGQQSTLKPLLDFSPRTNEPFEKWYLQGRYGGVPFLEEPLILAKEASDEAK